MNAGRSVCICPSGSARALGKHEDRPALLQLVDHRFDSFLADPFLIDGHGVQAADYRGEQGIFEEGLVRQVGEVPFDRQAHDPGIDEALMIGDDENGPGLGDMAGAFQAQAEAESEAGHAGDVEEVIPEGTPRHLNLFGFWYLGFVISRVSLGFPVSFYKVRARTVSSMRSTTCWMVRPVLSR